MEDEVTFIDWKKREGIIAVSNVDMEDKMFIKELKYRSFSHRRRRWRMR